MVKSIRETVHEVIEFIANPDPAYFERLALYVYSFQFSHNQSYRNYCLGKNITPDSVSSWEEIPAVPTTAFKAFDLSCLSPGEVPEAVFLTSGTTRGEDDRGKHLVPQLSVHRSAILGNFERYLLPDKARLRMIILTGPRAIWPQSSLAFMMETVRTAFGADGSDFFVNEKGLELDRLVQALKRADQAKEPVFLLGLSLAFSQLIEELRTSGVRLSLSEGSRVMDTGGFKGKPVVMNQHKLNQSYEKYFGIAQNHIVNEYGMTELSSQFYDNTLRDHILNRSDGRYKSIPPWVKTQVVDPETLQEVPPGTVGMLKHVDLANCGTVSALITEDLGYTVKDGFVLLGRIEGAESRGCSLLMEELRASS